MSLPLLILLGVLLSLDSGLFEALFLKRRAESRHISSLSYKMLAAGGFCGTGLLMALYSGDSRGFLIFSGLILGMLGDFFLGLRKVSSLDHRLFFGLGILAFSTGPIFYAAALLRLNAFSPLPVAVIFLILMLCTEAFLRVHQVKGRKVHISALLYIGVEAFMCSVALMLAYQHTSLGSLLFVTGSFSFLASDNLLAAFSFGDLSSGEVDQALHATYLGAQLFIAWSILFLF